jgi:isoleucyl-tRNA synthetase
MSSSSSSFRPVSSDVQLPALEREVLQLWDERKIFEKSLEQTRGGKPYSFYDGPPFATGLPHYGHLLAGTLKDIVPRYWTMKGYHVPRRFGWDCHGLPVEYEINKTYKIESNRQILEEFGVARYNEACRSIVQRYSTEWKTTVKRVGRWVDMENAYFTMNPEFMESVWWVFQQLWKKGLIYEGHKVVPYSTGISTPLSNFEANQNYKMVQDPAITVSFPILGDPRFPNGAAFLAWTTTPWTLPSNLGLAVGRELAYVLVREKASGRHFVLAEALLKGSFKNPEQDLERVAAFTGADLVGVPYEPLFGYFADRRLQGAFRVIAAEHVTAESGTGIVHMAPAFGEEDYLACKAAGIPLVNPVDDDGMFTAEVPEYQGKRVKDADKEIIAELKARGRLHKQETINHSYPFCWRSDTPLIYRAVSSWYVAVEKIRDEIVAANRTTHWVPEHLRDGRFGNWLEGARDWAISRNRFWGTPLPVWKNDSGEVICVGSIAELEKLSGAKVTDLHLDKIQHLEIPSPTGKSPLKLVGTVLDCWFESGSMPYAQGGYPRAQQTEFERSFPAEFIAEGLDQTRGWFYTLMVLGTALFGKAPFRNVVVNGLILAEDGKKMSKSLRNYPDPLELIERHGADALRLYLIDSPVVKAQELRFSEGGVKDVVRRILLRWWNSYAFFVSYANIDGFRPRGDAAQSPNVLDQWVLSRLNSLVVHTEKEMAAYRLYNVVPRLLQFVEELTNTYIRFNRSHFWQEGMPEDKRLAFETLYEVLHTLTRVMAPFAPFLSESMYQNLAAAHPAGARQSVHLERFPEARAEQIRPELEEAVRALEVLVMLGRNTREKIGVKAKIPLRSMKIFQRDARVLETLKRFEPYFKEELNIAQVEYSTDEDSVVQVTAKANFPVLGKRLGPKMKAVAAAIQALGLPELLRLEQGEKVQAAGEWVSFEDVEIRRAPKAGNERLNVDALVSVEIDPTVTPEQQREGLAREVIRKIQQARKNARFNLDDRIVLELACGGEWREAVEAHRSMIQEATLAKGLSLCENPSGVHREEVELEAGSLLKIGLTAVQKSEGKV